MALRNRVEEYRETEHWPWRPNSETSQESSLLYDALVCQTGKSNVSLVEHTSCTVKNLEHRR